MYPDLPNEPPTRVCNVCKVEKPLTGFARSRLCKFGRRYECSECQRKSGKAFHEKKMLDPEYRERRKANSKKHYEDNPDYYHAWKLKERYNISIERYFEMLESQGNTCKICKQGCRRGRRLCVDHDHSCCPGDTSCGKCIRGLLCTDCNFGLFGFQDNPSSLESAIVYLEEYHLISTAT